ncbi:MAG: DUF983 domain-containing protein [Neorhizobium sp.]|nr:DUF983 domain-containing protein [Neorhizobium sp.]
MAQDLRHEFVRGGAHVPAFNALRGRCPRCGEGPLFEGFSQIRPHCDACHLDYGFAEPHEGPAVALICLACVPGVAFGVGLETFIQPPLWLHLITSLPLLFLTTIAPLRPLKAYLAARRYREKCLKMTFGKADGTRP